MYVQVTGVWHPIGQIVVILLINNHYHKSYLIYIILAMSKMMIVLRRTDTNTDRMVATITTACEVNQNVDKTAL